MDIKSKTIDLGNGRPITIETGKLARQADGAVVVKMGDTMLLATIVARKEAGKDVDFLPLTVEYREKFSAAGKFPGGFFKRESRPSDSEILTMRLVDRALRPLFPDDFHADTQVIISLISADKHNLPDALACLAATAAIAVSDIPFNGPVSEVRVVRVDGKFIINPTVDEMKNADIEMMVAGTLDSIVMVEGEMKQVSEAEMIQAIEAAHIAIKIQCQAIVELGAMVPKAKTKREYNHEDKDEDLKAKVHAACYQLCYDAAKKGLGKEERSEAFHTIRNNFETGLTDEQKENKGFLLKKYFHDTHKQAVRDMVIKENIRLDGRNTTQIRPIWSEVDYLPGTHGSSIFTRGETQSLTTLTLGSKLDQQTIDSALREDSETFMLHYNFPPFSTGESKPLRGTGRREIGHGNLALRALKAVMPVPPENPYTVRLVSEILESNGSSSMATVCAGTLALMDGGVKITAPVSGIAMGLITEKGAEKYAVLSDILGDEDHLGDMDFKVTGTRKGITACQMDIKIEGLSYDMLKQALEQAKQGRLHILGEMEKTIAQPREDYKPHAPRIVSIEIPGDMIGAVIGPGGKVIQEIQKETKTVIVIEETPKGGRVDIVASDKASIDAAMRRVKNIVFPPTAEIGEEYEGIVKSIMPYGAFVEIMPGVDGLLHVSELEWRKVDKVEEVLTVGQMVKIKITGKDPKSGKMKLSRKILLPKPENSRAAEV